MSDRPAVIEDAGTAYQLGIEALLRDDLDQAIELLELAIRFAPCGVDSFVALGIAHARRLEVYPALDAFEGAVAIDPSHFAARLHLAELHFHLRAPDLARAHLEAALAVARSWEERAVARRLLKEEEARARMSFRRPSFVTAKPVPLRPGVAGGKG